MSDEQENRTVDYPLKNMPLTLDVVRYWLDRFPFNRDEAVRKQKIVTFVANRHGDGGGLPPQGGPRVKDDQVTKVLNEYCKAGRLEKVSYGFYRLSGEPPEAEAADPLLKDEGDDDVERDPAPELGTVGSGTSCVYVYYFPGYRKLAKLESQESFACKIGFSDGDPFYRVARQIGTGHPERPVLGLVIRSDRGDLIEDWLHATLTVWNRQIISAGGIEWFITSPEEVLGLYEQFVAPHEAPATPSTKSPDATA
jgi:hypothetical protein